MIPQDINSDTSSAVLQLVMNSDLSILLSWFDQNRLRINNDKTQALTMGPCTYNYDIILNDVQIETQRSTKILGVTLDRMLSFKDHISGQLKKAHAQSAALRRIRRFASVEVMTGLYKSFVLPYFEYCSHLLSSLGKVQVNRFEDANFEIYSRLY